MKKYTIVKIASLFATVLSLKALPIAAASPDLRITQVIEAGNNAYVRVRNTGLAPSGACHLRVYHRFGGPWFVTATPAVPGLAVGASTWITVVNAGIAAPFNHYRVDIFNVVPELSEANNSYSTP